MNVNDDLLIKYLDLFHNTYRETVDKFIPKENFDLLIRYSLLNYGIIGYISTQFGAGFEYVEDKSRTEIKVSSARIEDAFFNTPSRIRKLPPSIHLLGKGVFTHVSFGNGVTFRLGSSNASAILTDVKVESDDWKHNVIYAELYANRTKEFWSEKNAISRAKDEVLLALTDICLASQKAISIENYLKTFKEKQVLILGDFSNEGKERIKQIKDKLKLLRYEGTTLNDVPENLNYNLSQKATAVAAVSKFIIVDDSSKAGHVFELAHLKSNDWITIILRLEGSEGTYMTRGMSQYSSVILEKNYQESNLEQALAESTVWAENKISELKRDSADIYPWRKT